MTVRMLFRGLLFYVGIVLFLFSSTLLYAYIHFLCKKEGIVGLMHEGAPDSAIQIAILKNGFETLIVIGVVIISILLMGFFKDWNKEEINN